MIGRTPTAEEKRWMNDITQIGCIVCRLYLKIYTPAEVHHIDGKTKAEAHKKTLPLCHPHHRLGKDTKQFTSRHPWRVRFIERYGTEAELLECTKMLVEAMRACM